MSLTPSLLLPLARVLEDRITCTQANKMGFWNQHRKTQRTQDSRRKGRKGEAGSEEWDDVCAICDDGGRVTCCDGGCLRSFHPTKKHGEKSMCTGLGITEEQWRILRPKGKKYICKNCRYKQHQCFACGLLGSSDLSSGAEVFQCKDKKCGHFYHPKCVAGLFYPDSKIRALYFEQRVAGRLEFRCPMHRCSLCKGGENKDDKKMQFAVCRRCPTAYHRKCLPSDIVFNASDDTAQRAWDDILPDQILIYCMKHEIEPKLGTPKRNHIVFPDAKNLLVAKRPKVAPKEQDILNEDELPDHSAEPSQSPLPAETDHDLCFSSNHRDSFAPKSLFPHPQPGSCGWLDD